MNDSHTTGQLRGSLFGGALTCPEKMLVHHAPGVGVPSSTMGSRRARAVRSWQGMRQKALAEPDSIAAAAMDATDFMVESVVGLG